MDMVRNFHIGTAILTLVSIPVLYFIISRSVRLVQKYLGAGLDVVFWLADRYISKTIAERISLRHFCRVELAKEETKYLQVPGRNQVNLPTDDIFVPLMLDNASRDTTSDYEELWAGEANRVQVIGDPGSGKSSLVKRLFREQCYANLNGAFDARLPVWLELKSFDPPSRLNTPDSMGNWALRELRKRVTAVGGFNMEALFDSFLRDRGLLVLLDGFDEVPSESYKRVLSAVTALSARLANEGVRNRIILTMRTQFYYQIRDDLSGVFAQTYHVQPFTPSDIHTFLLKWPTRLDGGERQRAVNRIFGELADRPTLREMCTNPLILAMYVSRSISGYGSESPETRTEFYAQVVEELVIARRGRQLDLKHKGNLRKVREQIFGHIAFDNMTDVDQPANVIQWDKAIRFTMDICQCPELEAASIIREVCKETGLLTEERRAERLRFVHLTFCEFFAAKEAVEGRSNGWEEIVTLHGRSRTNASHRNARLIEVIPFMLGMMPRISVGPAVYDALACNDPFLSGRAFLETQHYEHSGWPLYVKSESDALLQVARDDWNDEWLRRLHLFNVVLADEGEWRKQFRRTTGSQTLETLFAKLVQDDKSRLVELFGSYAVVDPQAAFRLARACGLDLIAEEPQLVVSNLESPPFYSLILEEIAQGRVDRVRASLIIFEASLCSSAVAARAYFDDRTLISESAHFDGRKERWYLVRSEKDARFLRLSLLTLAATIATCASDAEVREFPRVRMMKESIRPPASFLWSRFTWLSQGRALTIAGVVCGSALFYVVFGPPDWPGWSLLPFVTLCYLMLPLLGHALLYPRAMTRIYDDLLYPGLVAMGGPYGWRDRLRKAGYLFAAGNANRMLRISRLALTLAPLQIAGKIRHIGPDELKAASKCDPTRINFAAWRIDETADNAASLHTDAAQ